jgi:arylformamidase
MRLIDVSVPLDASLPAYPGNTPFLLEPVKRIARGDSSNLSTLHLSAHAGTHIDAPRHFLDDGPGADELSLELLIGPARVIEITTRPQSGAIGPSELEGAIPPGTLRVLIKTANSELWSLPSFREDYVGVSAAGARFLVDFGIKVLGVDYLSVEQFREPHAPAHHALLGGGVVVIEGLNLKSVAPGAYDMVCLPLRVVGSDGAPARVVLRTN